MTVGLRRGSIGILLGVLVGFGVIGVLFARRRSSKRFPAPIPVPVMIGTAQPRAQARERGVVLTLLGLLLAVGSVVAVSVLDNPLRPFSILSRSSDSEGGTVPTLPQPEAGVGSAENGGQGAQAQSGPNAETGRRDDRTRAQQRDPVTPTFGIVRVDPNGNAVVTGTARPNGTVELLVDGKPTARAVADADGRFALAPPALPSGTSDIVLRETDSRAHVRRSSDSIVVAVSPSHQDKPFVALTSPDRPTVVLSRPAPSPTALLAAPNLDLGHRTARGQDAAGPTGDSREGGLEGTVSPGPVSMDASGTGRAAPDPAVEPETEARASTARASPAKDADIGGVNGTPVRIVSADAQDGGRLFVSGQAAVGSTVRLYLNDTFVAPAGTGRDETVTFTIGRGMKPGAYKVRLDQVDANSGKVQSRVEVPFTMPERETVARPGLRTEAPDAETDGQQAAIPETARLTSAEPNPAANPTDSSADAGKEALAPEGMSGTVSGRSASGGGAADVFVPEITTARIARGDNLWEISRRVYGAGDRYTVIYDANQDQIQNPDLIYPGQILVLPREDAADVRKDEKRG